MLGTCEQLAAGLGAGSGKKGKDGTPSSVGNAPLRLWVGQKFLGTFPLPPLPYEPARTDWCIYGPSTELYKRLGKGPRAQKQARANMHLAEVVEQIAKRASTAVWWDWLAFPILWARLPFRPGLHRWSYFTFPFFFFLRYQHIMDERCLGSRGFPLHFLFLLFLKDFVLLFQWPTTFFFCCCNPHVSLSSITVPYR